MSIHLKRRKMDKVILAIMYYFVSHNLASCAPSSGNLRVEISYHPLVPITKQDWAYPIHNVHFHHAHSEESARSFFYHDRGIKGKKDMLMIWIVWAIRLAKISKGLLDRRWSYETFSTGSIFGVDTGKDKGQKIADALKCEGLQIKKVDISSEDDVFVIPG
jgi:hypothetical protein